MNIDGILGQVRAEGRLLRQTWLLFRRDTAVLVRGVLLIVLVLTPVSLVISLLVFGLFHGPRRAPGVGPTLLALVLILLCVLPLVAGLMGIVIRRVREHRGGLAREIFRGYRQYRDLALASLAVFACQAPYIATQMSLPRSLQVLAIPLQFVGLLTVYLIPTIVDQRLRFAAALRRSVALLKGGELWRTLVAVLTPVLLQNVQLIPDGLTRGELRTFFDVILGVADFFVLLPLSVVYLTCMYFRSRGEDELLEAAIGGGEIEVELPSSP